MDDRSLKIDKVEINDEGVYICRVENSVGFHEAEARLTVLCMSFTDFQFLLLEKFRLMMVMG